MNLTTVIVNYQTPELLQTAVKSFLKYYPDVPILIFDNGSRDQSIKVIEELAKSYDSVTAHYEEDNIFHGPAMHKSLTELVHTTYCFFLDSDTETKAPGFLEKAVTLLAENDNHYAAGHLEKINKRGFKDENGTPVILSPYLLLKSELYHQFSPFIHHGQPVLKNFTEAQNQGFKLIHFPMYDYIDHEWRGTASKFGYKLGIRGKIDYLLNKIGI